MEAFADAGADVVAAYTITGPEEGIGIARAARQAGVPVLVGFTVETDGRLPDGTPLREAVALVEAEDAPDGFIVNCAHPTHIAPALEDGEWLGRIVQVNPNASTLSHAELDAAEELDAGDLGLLTSSYDALRARLPGLAVVGGCCGTDARHVAALWHFCPPVHHPDPFKEKHMNTSTTSTADRPSTADGARHLSTASAGPRRTTPPR